MLRYILSRLFTGSKEVTVRSLSQKQLLSKFRQSPCKIPVEEELHFSLNLKDACKMNSFTDILQKFCLHFNQRCISFRNFNKTNLTESFSITTYDLSARIL